MLHQLDSCPLPPVYVKKKECLNLCFPNRLIKVQRITGFLAMCNIGSVLEQQDTLISREVAAHTLTHELLFFFLKRRFMVDGDKMHR